MRAAYREKRENGPLGARGEGGDKSKIEEIKNSRRKKIGFRITKTSEDADGKTYR